MQVNNSKVNNLNKDNESFKHNKEIEGKLEELKQKSLIIFDWDGTLMDSIGLIVESMHVAGQKHGFNTTDEAVKSIIGLSLIKGIKVLYPTANDDECKAIQQSYGDYYIQQSLKPSQSKFFEGIELMLQQLITNDKQLAVATGKKRAGLARVMSVSNSEHYFVYSRCADESGSKPDPQMLLDILHKTQLKINDAVFIGDSIHDIKMANALNMTSIAVNYGAGSHDALSELNPTFHIDTPEELINLLTHNMS